MTLIEIVQTLRSIALNQPNIRTVTEGSVYDSLNTNPKIQYDVVHLTQTTHQTDEYTDTYGFNIFYISRLEDSLEDNKLQIQSIGKDILDNILRTFCENFNIDYPTITFTPFTQKFADLCAGVFCNVRIEVPKTIWCADDYLSETVPGKDIKLQDMGVTITQNGLRVITPDAEYDGIGEIRIDVQVPQSSAVLQDKEVTFTANDVYTVYPDNDYDGMTSVQVEVDVPDRYNEGYESGYTDGTTDGFNSGFTSGKTEGIAEQKAKLTGITITDNGEYSREDGYSAITVSVSTGQTINNQDKTVSISGLSYENGYYTGQTTVNADSGYTGLGTVTINTSIDASDAITEGENNQKALLSSTSFTQNSAYTNANGWSAITINVPSDYQEGYNSGYTDGQNAQKALLSSTSFTENSAYTSENGWSSVTVNVSAATDRDLIANLQGDYFVIPSGTTHLRNFAFYGWWYEKISAITIPNSVTGIGQYALAAYGLVSITIPASVNQIESDAFYNCSTLTAMTFEGLTPPTINTGNSLGSTAYTFPIYVPCQSVDAYKTAFGQYYAPRIQCIPEPLNIVYYYNPEPGTLLLTNRSNIVSATLSGGTNIPLNEYPYDTKYIFPSTGLNSVSYQLGNSYTLSASCFSYCESIYSADIPYGVVVLGDMLFSRNRSLVAVSIPASVTAIGFSCFDSAISLTNITIPASVTSIGKWCFQDCSGLTAMTFEGTTPPVLDQEALGLVSEGFTFPIYVPASAVETYKSAPSWSQYASRITAIP